MWNVEFFFSFFFFSLAGVRRACPALKPDAADQVLLKNRAGFAAFSKGRAFHRCLEQDRCAGDREAGTGGASRRRGDALRRVAMPVAQDVSPRLIPMVICLVPRPCLGFSHDCVVSDPCGRDGSSLWFCMFFVTLHVFRVLARVHYNNRSKFL